VFLSVLQPKGLWEKTGRWDTGIGKDVMYKIKDGIEVGLGPTHEEMLTDIVKNYIENEDDLPFAIYQIQTKFRKEARAKSGLLRGREFLMKDLYSFHVSETDFKQFYEKAKKAYGRIFERCGLKAIITEASGGGFSKEFSHEFQIISEAGEDTIYFCPKEAEHFSQNEEIFDQKTTKCPVCKTALQKVKSIEAANIFSLGVKYSEPLAAFFRGKDGQKYPVIMGCYGIGVSRLMAAIVEVCHDDKGIVWPKEVAPFLCHLIPIVSGDAAQDKKTVNAAEKIYQDLQKKGIEVLYDERGRKFSTGEKFADADLIGAPTRIVVSQKTLAKSSAEIKQRNEEKTKLVPLKDLALTIKNNLQ
ncbi:MAG: aminoacyl--tRNA ligase-related protein, partial [Patescibacteria group bacterium]